MVILCEKKKEATTVLFPSAYRIHTQLSLTSPSPDSKSPLLPNPFRLPTLSTQSMAPPLGWHFSAHSSFSFSSTTCSSVRPCMFGGSVVPWLASSSISETVAKCTEQKQQITRAIRDNNPPPLPCHPDVDEELYGCSHNDMNVFLTTQNHGVWETTICFLYYL